MSASKVVVVDYGVGNILSIKRALEYIGAQVRVTNTHEEILAAERLILPGVGAFKTAMLALEKLQLIGVLQEISYKKTPLLGICLGMQLLLDESEEFGFTKGLGLIPGKVIPLPSRSVSGNILKVPKIGWNELRPSGTIDFNGTILKDLKPKQSVYFVHSFMAQMKLANHCLADYDCGGHSIAAVIQKDAIYGCQFHPEKSGDVGLSILRNFLSS